MPDFTPYGTNRLSQVRQQAQRQKKEENTRLFLIFFLVAFVFIGFGYYLSYQCKTEIEAIRQSIHREPEPPEEVTEEVIPVEQQATEKPAPPARKPKKEKPKPAPVIDGQLHTYADGYGRR